MVSPSCMGELMSDRRPKDSTHLNRPWKDNAGNIPGAFAEDWSTVSSLTS
jgi:hypothetical protein